MELNSLHLVYWGHNYSIGIIVLLRVKKCKKISRSKIKMSPRWIWMKLRCTLPYIHCNDRNYFWKAVSFHFNNPLSGEGIIPRKIGQGLPKTLTLSIFPTLFIVWMKYPIYDRSGQDRYRISDQNGWKSAPFGAAYAYIAYHEGRTPPPPLELWSLR